MFKWGYIGSGSICKNTANDITKGEHIVSAVYSRNVEHAKEFAENFGSTVYSNVDEMLEKADIDGVYIGVPHNLHFEFAKKAILAGKPVLCEKPMTVNADDTKELFRLAEEKGVYIAEAMWTWYSPVARKVREWVQSGKIGDNINMKASFEIPIANSKNPKERVIKPEYAGGALLDVGIYPVTYAYVLFGKPDKISVEGHLENGIDLSEKIVFEYNNGNKAVLGSSIENFSFNTCTIKGSRGKITLPPFFHSVSKAALSGEVKEKFKVGNRRSEGLYLIEFDAVVSEINKGLKKSEYVPPMQTIAVMEILDEIRSILGLKYPFEK